MTQKERLRRRASASRRYNATPKGRAALHRYRASSKGQKAFRLYRASLGYHKIARRYRAKNTVKLAIWRSVYEAKKGGYSPVSPNTIQPKPADSRCDFCAKKRGYLHLDHDHLTGDLRGWLCAPCNRAFGVLGDNAKAMRRGLAYMNGRLHVHDKRPRK